MLHKYLFTYEDLEENALKHLKREKEIRNKKERKNERKTNSIYKIICRTRFRYKS